MGNDYYNDQMLSKWEDNYLDPDYKETDLGQYNENERIEYEEGFYCDEIKGIYKGFLDALKAAGCETCSIEARTDDFKTDIADALAILKTLI